MAHTAQPLVSILIRSMDRPTLQRALDSAAAQTWPNLEIVVVAACGRSHRPLPDRHRGRPLRLILPEGERRLMRAEAANAALEAAAGEWLNFLDDDDELLPAHVAALLGAPRRGERLIFSRTRVVDAHGALLGHVSHAGNHVQLYFHSRATTCATLLHRSLVDDGVRFDPAFAVHEDHDFQVNCATRTQFRFVDAPTCIWHAQAGESGCGFGDNDDPARREASVASVRRKWHAAFERWLSDFDAVLHAGEQYLHGGDLGAAGVCATQALRMRPDDGAARRLADRVEQKSAAQGRVAQPSGEARPGSARSAPLPLVSILIRSMDRPTLQRALDSAAAQTWPHLEIVVAAANGAAHRGLPDHWNGRPLRLIYPEPDRRLPRPEAANVCLDHARGEWLNFLDDDDALLPQHIATLLAAPRVAAARVLYSRARVHDADGRATGHVGFASFPVQLYFQNRSHPAATLFHRSLVAEGARFDAAFDVYEDHDFFVNCATRSEFQFVDAETCIWNAHVGASGCGHGSNDDAGQRERYHAKLHRKWADFFGPLLRQPESLLFVGQQYLRVNELPVALDCLERALAARPGDINALNLSGLANLRAGNLDRAEALLTQALRQLPQHPGLKANLDLLHRARAQRATQQK